MKKVIILLLCLTTCLLTNAQELSKPKNMVLVPWGALDNVTVQSFYMSNEITNSQFKEFVHYLKRNPADSLMTFEMVNKKIKATKTRNADILKNNIDTGIMNSEIKKYFTDKAYDDYPVVGVTFTAATMYCAWKSKNRTDNYITRLPLEIEWKYAYAAANIPPEKNINNKIQPVDSGKSSKLGLFHMSDNVSEWTADKTIMGDSWKSDSKPMDKVEISSGTKNNFTGFRVVETYLGRSK